MLIYLLPQVQKRVLSVFHFGLRNKGVLFLGPSETLGDLANEFEEVERRWRLFRKRRDVRLPTSSLPFESGKALMEIRRVGDQDTLTKFRHQTLVTSALNSLLNRYVPSGLLVDRDNDLVHCLGDARKLLTFPEGKPTNNVLQLLDRELSASVSAALHHCKKQAEAVVFNGLQLPFAENESVFQMKVESLEEKNETLFLISFSEIKNQPEADPKQVQYEPFPDGDEFVDQLKLELKYTRETLQATVEELESSNEELQATNEELIASNEELQSTNEELQSTNEELQTVNQENRRRIDQLGEVTEDLELLLSRTATGLLFLDEHLRIRKFTRLITRYFDLRLHDIGRPIEHFSHRTGVKNLYQQLREAVESGSEFTLVSELPSGVSLLVEVTLKNEDDNLSGIVLTIGHKTVQGFGLASKQVFPASRCRFLALARRQTG